MPKTKNFSSAAIKAVFDELRPSGENWSEVADRCSISSSSISLVRNGKRRLTANVAQEFAKAVGVSTSELYQKLAEAEKNLASGKRQPHSCKKIRHLNLVEFSSEMGEYLGEMREGDKCFVLCGGMFGLPELSTIPGSPQLRDFYQSLERCIKRGADVHYIYPDHDDANGDSWNEQTERHAVHVLGEIEKRFQVWKQLLREELEITAGNTPNTIGACPKLFRFFAPANYYLVKTGQEHAGFMAVRGQPDPDRKQPRYDLDAREYLSMSSKAVEKLFLAIEEEVSTLFEQE